MSDDLYINDSDRVQWVGSELAAPGPGTRIPGFNAWWLLGTVLRVSRTDPGSIKVEWDNGRVTIERCRNLERMDVIALA